MTTNSLSVADLFDLVAPITICGAADCMFEAKAIEAWRKIIDVPAEVWKDHGIEAPSDLFENLAEWDLKDSEDFNTIYRDFAADAYTALFDALIEENGDGNWELGYDYWGAKGYKRPGDTSKTFTLSGDTGGILPMYETAALLIEHIGELEAGK